MMPPGRTVGAGRDRPCCAARTRTAIRDAQDAGMLSRYGIDLATITDKLGSIGKALRPPPAERPSLRLARYLGAGARYSRK